MQLALAAIHALVEFAPEGLSGLRQAFSCQCFTRLASLICGNNDQLLIQKFSILACRVDTVAIFLLTTSLLEGIIAQRMKSFHELLANACNSFHSSHTSEEDEIMVRMLQEERTKYCTKPLGRTLHLIHQVENPDSIDL